MARASAVPLEADESITPAVGCLARFVFLWFAHSPALLMCERVLQDIGHDLRKHSSREEKRAETDQAVPKKWRSTGVMDSSAPRGAAHARAISRSTLKRPLRSPMTSPGSLFTVGSTDTSLGALACHDGVPFASHASESHNLPCDSGCESGFRTSLPPVAPGPHNHRTRALTSARTSPP